MDRKKLVELFRKGMPYAPGRYRFWVWRCFEISVLEDSVELDEYEGFTAGNGDCENRSIPDLEDMFHVGRSILNRKDGRSVEQEGLGWNRRTAKNS